MGTVKYTLHIETDIELEFEPWEDCDEEEYAEQVARDCIRSPDYAEGQVKTGWISVDVSKEDA